MLVGLLLGLAVVLAEANNDHLVHPVPSEVPEISFQATVSYGQEGEGGAPHIELAVAAASNTTTMMNSAAEGFLLSRDDLQHVRDHLVERVEENLKMNNPYWKLPWRPSSIVSKSRKAAHDTALVRSELARLPNRTFVGTESFAQASSVMWEQVWSMRSVVGDFIWTVSSPLPSHPDPPSEAC